MTPRCNYHDGMFANEDWSGPLTGLEPAFEADAAAFHEAGRAVAGYALSFGCASVEVTINHRTVEIDDGEASLWGFTGVSYASKREHKLAVAAMRAGSLQAAIALGVGICAGPDRRFAYLRLVWANAQCLRSRARLARHQQRRGSPERGNGKCLAGGAGKVDRTPSR